MKNKTKKRRTKALIAVSITAFLALYLSLYFAVISGSRGTEEKEKNAKSEPITPIPFGNMLRPASLKMPEIPVMPEMPEAQHDPLLPISECSMDFPDTVSLYDTVSGKISSLKLEDYVLGVLLSEMPSSYHPEALKAQSIACRTYTLYRILNYPDAHGNGAELCTSASHCQCYTDPGSVGTERYTAAKNAVDETRGIIMTYENAPILAVFHASSYKTTKSSEEVFGGRLPYLVPAESFECFDEKLDTSKKYIFSKNEIASCLKSVCPELSGKSDRDIISELILSYGKYPNGNEISLFGEAVKLSDISDCLKLRSSDIAFSESGDGITVTAYGYGHGVGLSQCGAQELALSGYTAPYILSHYYKGIAFSKI